MGSKILVIGGSGFLSGTLARTAVAQGHQVWTVTRGQRSATEGVTPLTADRHDRDSFASTIATANTEWDLVVDCIGYHPEDAVQDIELFRERTPHLVFVSTDFVFHPAHRRLPQSEETDHYLQESYGGDKRLCELELMNGDTGGMAWTVVRPCHIYGPGSQLGCLPLHGRNPELIDHLRAGKSLALVGGGYFLQQPILAADLSATILSCAGNKNTYDQIFCTSGPDTIESRTYYQIIADILDVELTVEEIPVDQHLREHPEAAPFLCHRIYNLSKLKASGASVPSTSIEQGLREHTESLLD
ncbi:MAG: NAD-dependent epimerase/dehydratase family protein [Gemmatimonadetes bacterium]|jgi:nucleoside-diphosphate-sugar epimerase|nr:NAD-dependent epimerase/dehydratase family protein [Gemmatimonadota bacterium]